MSAPPKQQSTPFGSFISHILSPAPVAIPMAGVRLVRSFSRYDVYEARPKGPKAVALVPATPKRRGPPARECILSYLHDHPGQAVSCRTQLGKDMSVGCVSQALTRLRRQHLIEVDVERTELEQAAGNVGRECLWYKLQG